MNRGARIGFAAGLAALAAAASACSTCRPAVRAEVYDGQFAGTLGLILLPLALIVAVGVGIYRSDQ